MALLRQAFEEGSLFGTWVHSDTDLLVLSDHPDFQALLQPRDDA